MGEYFESDDAYRAAIRALAAGEIDPGGELGRLGAEALQRLQAAGLPWVFDRCANVFVEYHEKMMASPARLEAERGIRDAMLELADKLRSSGLAREFIVQDAAVWERIAGKLDHASRVDVLAHSGGIPKCWTPLETYLRAAAEQITEGQKVFGPAFDQYLGQVMPPGKHSSNLERFIFRRTTVLVGEIAEEIQGIEEDGQSLEIPSEYRPRPFDEFTRNEPGLPYRHVTVAARLASILLAKDIRQNQITKANEGTANRRRNNE
ncbi:MAG: hypothetical protein LPK43_03810 [Gammaproteobacteria bacterium]|nr:hypothetical protein [Gammaproteobacteria bacterium]